MPCFSALQRAEIAEIRCGRDRRSGAFRFSALQRAEIAEIWLNHAQPIKTESVSVLFNEPKLLKYPDGFSGTAYYVYVSVLFNEPKLLKWCSATTIRPSVVVSVLFNEPKLLK